MSSSPLSDLESILFLFIEEKINDSEFIKSIKISSEAIAILQNIVKKQPVFIQDILKQVTNILKGSKLDAYDIPSIILLIKDVVNLNKVDLRLSRFNIIELIKNILIIVLESELIKIDNKDDYIKLIVSSVALLETTIDIEETTVSCNCFGFKK
jgi:hypothetical protein